MPPKKKMKTEDTHFVWSMTKSNGYQKQKNILRQRKRMRG